MSSLQMLPNLRALSAKSNLDVNIEWLNVCQRRGGGGAAGPPLHHHHYHCCCPPPPPNEMVSPTINAVHLWCSIKECRAVHRCGTLVLGVFLEKDKLLPLSPVITHSHTHTCIQHGEKNKVCDAVRKVKICKWTQSWRINPVIHSSAPVEAQVSTHQRPPWFERLRVRMWWRAEAECGKWDRKKLLVSSRRNI